MREARVTPLLILVLGLCMIMGCGMVGPPVPPETVGVAPIIERQEQLRSQPDDAPRAPMRSEPGEEAEFMGPVGQDQALPPLRPIGTR
jgi:hypothetical protein